MALPVDEWLLDKITTGVRRGAKLANSVAPLLCPRQLKPVQKKVRRRQSRLVAGWPLKILQPLPYECMATPQLTGPTAASAATVEQQVPALIRQFIDYDVVKKENARLDQLDKVRGKSETDGSEA